MVRSVDCFLLSRFIDAAGAQKNSQKPFRNHTNPTAPNMHPTNHSGFFFNRPPTAASMIAICRKTTAIPNLLPCFWAYVLVASKFRASVSASFFSVL